MRGYTSRMTPRRLLFLLLALTLPFGASSLPARAQDEPVQDEDAKPKPKKKAKKKAFDYEKSKYKSLEPSQTKSYKFNDKGDPIDPDAKKKAAAKKKKKAAEPPEMSEAGEGCGGEDSCAEKRTEADAL